jgi:hypothetical protein
MVKWWTGRQLSKEEPPTGEAGQISRRTFLLAGLGTVVGASGVIAISRLMERPDEAPYVQLDWERTDTDPSAIDWVSFPGDPEAGPNRQDWKGIGVLATNKARFDEQQAETDSYHAVVFRDPDGIVHVGYRPDGQSFFGVEALHPGQYRVGMRIGELTLMASMGLWSPEDRHFTPVDTDAAARATRDRIREDHPGISIA